jgi:hypothetical protein
MTERERDRHAAHRLVIIRQAQELTGNVSGRAATTGSAGRSTTNGCDATRTVGSRRYVIGHHDRTSVRRPRVFEVVTCVQALPRSSCRQGGPRYSSAASDRRPPSTSSARRWPERTRRLRRIDRALVENRTRCAAGVAASGKTLTAILG